MTCSACLASIRSELRMQLQDFLASWSISNLLQRLPYAFMKPGSPPVVKIMSYSGCYPKSDAVLNPVVNLTTGVFVERLRRFVWCPGMTLLHLTPLSLHLMLSAFLSQDDGIDHLPVLSFFPPFSSSLSAVLNKWSSQFLISALHHVVSVYSMHTLSFASNLEKFMILNVGSSIRTLHKEWWTSGTGCPEWL